MKLLIVTQAVATEDPVLGFFHRWIEELAKRFEHIDVICLKEGKSALPQNVRVYSLGKEHGARTRAAYAFSFLRLAWKLRRDYDAVFVHMNQEYVLIAGFLWKLLGKPIYLWRNHKKGTFLTRLAVALSSQVFCTSAQSYTARFKKTTLMPVGVDTERFKPDPSVPRTLCSILFLARMSPVKKPEVLLEALKELARKGVLFTADFVGSPLPYDVAYYENLKASAAELGTSVRFLPGVPNEETPALYRSHEIFINTTPSGAFDKTIFEAAASGALVLAASDDYARSVDARLSIAEADARGLTDKLEAVFALSEEEKQKLRGALQKLAQEQSLGVLIDRLVREMRGF